MRVLIATALTCIALILQTIAPRAQAVDTNKMQMFTKSDLYKNLVSRALTSIPQTIFQRCPSLVSNRSTISIAKPIIFGEDGTPNAGLWRQSFPVNGCGNDTILNIFFSAGADEKINTIIGLSGTTLADLKLQQDTLLYAHAGASLVARDCKTFEVKNTKFEGYGLPNPETPDPGADSRFRPWWETWTMTGCGRVIAIPLDFIPDATGTRIIQPGGSIEQ